MGMLKSLFGSRPTTKGDIVLAVAGAVMAAFKAVDVIHQYKIEHEIKKENAQ